MGNCQAAEAAAVLIQHPGGNKVDRFYSSVTANHIMTSNPGHYVALVLTSPENGLSVKQLKLLRPDDSLLIGQVYRLITFEDVLKEFDAKKCVKLGKLFKDRANLKLHQPNKNASNSQSSSSLKTQQEVNHRAAGSSNGGNRRHQGGGGAGQWRPALQSISELET